MDFTELVEGYKCKTCVFSVDAGPDGTYYDDKHDYYLRHPELKYR